MLIRINIKKVFPQKLNPLGKADFTKENIFITAVSSEETNLSLLLFR